MPERCVDVRVRLSAYLDGALDPDEMQDVMRHVASCPACGRELENMRAVDEALRVPSIAPEVEADARERTLARLQGEPDPAWMHRPKLARLRLTPMQWGLPLAAAAAVVVTLRLTVFNPSEAPRLETARHGTFATSPQSPGGPSAPAEEQPATEQRTRVAPVPAPARSEGGATAMAQTAHPAQPKGAPQKAQAETRATMPLMQKKEPDVSPGTGLAADNATPAAREEASQAAAPMMASAADSIHISKDALRGTTTMDVQRQRIVPLGTSYADTTGPWPTVVQALTQRTVELKRLAPPQTPEERMALAREWSTISTLWLWVARTSTSPDERGTAAARAVQAASIAQTYR